MTDVSVIVCTRNRAKAIGPCLDNLAVTIRNVPDAAVEIVLVDNGSSDDTVAVVSEWAGRHGERLLLVSEPRKGLSRARNAGIAAARGEWLVFTDDDCRVSPTYLRELLDHSRGDHGPVLRGGRVVLGDPDDMDFTTLDEPDRRVYDPATGSQGAKLHLGGWILGCNMAIPREAALRVGRFDERFGAGGRFRAGEDSDFLIRCHLAGIPIEYVPDMVVWHHHGRRTLPEIHELLTSYDIGEGALYMKHLSRFPRFARQFVWDCRNATKEWFGGSWHIPELRHSHSRKVACNLRGMAGFWLARRHGA